MVDLVCIGGPCDGRRVKAHEDERFVRVPVITRAPISWTSLVEVPFRSSTAVHYEVYEVMPFRSGPSGRVMRVLLPPGLDPADAMELLLERYPTRPAD